MAHTHDHDRAPEHTHEHAHDQDGRHPGPTGGPDTDSSQPLEHQREALMGAATWDERYSGDRVWSGRPNQRLVEQTVDLTPTTALDVACGEGGDALWLAEQGWDVTAVDVSEVVLAKLAEHARERGLEDRVKIGFYDAVADPRPVPHHHFDLVTVSFLHVPVPDFADIYRGIARAVAPGGRLLVTAHHPDQAKGPKFAHGADFLFGPERVIETLEAEAEDSEWEVEVCDAPTRMQETKDHGTLEFFDTVVRLRRRDA